MFSGHNSQVLETRPKKNAAKMQNIDNVIIAVM